MTTPVSPGFGLAPFGTTPFGMPETTPPARVALEPIAAKQIDPATQRFVVNDYGQYVGTTPVLQWVVMQVTLVQRSIPSDIELGNPSHRHPTLDSAHAQRVKAQLLQRLNTRVVRRQLQMPEKEPCLVVMRRTWAHGRPVTFARLHHPGSRYELTGHYTPPGTTKSASEAT